MKKYIFIEHNGNMISTYTQFTFQDLTLPFNAKIISILPKILNILLKKHPRTHPVHDIKLAHRAIHRH